MTAVLRLSAILGASGAGAIALVLALWPAWIHASWDLSQPPWRDAAWTMVLLARDGRVGEPSHQPWLATAIVLLILLSVWPHLRGLHRRAPAFPHPARQEDQIDSRIAGELAKVIVLVRSHLEANGHYAAALAKANTQLPSLVTPQQIQLLVSFLIAENESMRGKADQLQSNLEASQRQIEMLKTDLAEAQELGLSDPLTALRNRRGFDASLAHALVEAAGKQQPLSLIMADIDHFKSVNDRFGHAAGDAVLKWFAAVLSRNARGHDTVARYGGEEFAVILPETRIDGALRVAGQIKSQVERHHWTPPGAKMPALRLTASFGVAECGQGETAESLVGRADARLYDAQTAGRTRVSA